MACSPPDWPGCEPVSARLHLAAEDDLDRLMPLVAAYHALAGIAQDDPARRAAVLPLLQGSPHGAIWLVGLRRAPVGYIAVSFGWSIEMGGMDGFIDEFFIRENVRGRGMGTEVLVALLPQLAGAGLRAVHLEVAADDARTARLYERRGFRRRSGYNLMSWRA